MARRDVINAAMRLARQAGGRTNEPTGWDSPVVPEVEAPAPRDVLEFLARMKGEGTRREKAEATAKRVWDQPTVEFLSEAGPGLATQALGPTKAFSTIPRALGTTTALHLPGAIRAFMGEANAAESGQWEPPTPEQKKNSAWVKQQQQRLIGKGLYPKDAPPGYGTATEDALKREWKDEQDAARARGRQEQIESERLGLQRTQADTAKQEADAKKAEQDRKAKEGDAAANRKTEADAARDAIANEDKSSYAPMARTVGPWLGTLPGIVLGSMLAKWGGNKLTAGAAQRAEEANRLLKGNPSFADKLGNLNEFAARGQAKDPQNIFLRDDKARKAPFWKPNPDAPQSSELYPSTKGREYGLGMALPGVIGGAEIGAGEVGSRYYGNQAEEANKAFSDPNASAADVRNAAAQRDSAENKAAIAQGLSRVGIGTVGYGGVKSAYDTATRPSMRPNVGKADAWRNDVSEEIAKTRAKEAAKAAAKKAGKPEGKPPAAGGKKSNGSGAAPLVPLAAAPLLSGEPLPSTNEALPDSDERFQRGGTVGQAMRIAKQSGGAVVHAGPIKHDAAGGRTDTVPLDVASGSYVIPADIISGIGQGDTTSGYHKLTQMFGAQAPKPAQASGAPSVPILAAGGEFVISPEAVGRVGKGDLKAGHEALDLWVRMQRRKTIQELKKLPGPSRD